MPVRVAAADPGKPVRLVAKVNYAVCEKFCLPARANAALALGAAGARPTPPRSMTRAGVSRSG